MNINSSLLESFSADGFVVVEGVLDVDEVDALLEAVACLPVQGKLRGGIRGVLRKSRALREFAEFGAPAILARAILGAEAHAVKGTLFDKNPERNWKVPWHQDLTIAVEHRLDVAGFGPWSMKDGIPNVQAPVTVLEKLVAVRVHLDEAKTDSGALRVISGSHRHGKLTDEAIENLRRSIGEVVCPVGRGGLMLMAPLLLHASSASTAGSHRRVLHIEYSATPLPFGLEWNGV